jgi:hypothetical protein
LEQDQIFYASKQLGRKLGHLFKAKKTREAEVCISLIDIILQSIPASEKKNKFASWSSRICTKYDPCDSVALAKSMTTLMLKLNADSSKVEMKCEQQLAESIRKFSPHDADRAYKILSGLPPSHSSHRTSLLHT